MSTKKPNPFTKDEIGLKRKFKGKFPVMRCTDPFALSGLPRTMENSKIMPSLEVDDECLIVSEREFVSPVACEKYEDHSLTFFGFNEYSPL